MKAISRLLLLGLTICIIISSLPLGIVFASGEIHYTTDVRWDFVTDMEGFSADGVSARRIFTDNSVTALRVSASGTSFDGTVSAEMTGVNSEYEYLRFSIKNTTDIDELSVKLYEKDGDDFYGLNVPISKGETFEEYETKLSSGDVIRYKSGGQTEESKGDDREYLLSGSVSALSSISEYGKIEIAFTDDSNSGYILFENIILSGYKRPSTSLPVRWDFETAGDTEGFSEFEQNAGTSTVTIS